MKTVIAILVLLAAAASGCISLPDGLHVNETSTGCTTTGECPYGPGLHNYYYAPTREIVVAPNQSRKVWAHEACHAHQHQTILDSTGREPLYIDLQEWYSTPEGEAYMAVVEAHPRPTGWALSAENGIEDFAEACGRYLTGWNDREPNRDAFFENRGFQ